MGAQPKWERKRKKRRHSKLEQSNLRLRRFSFIARLFGFFFSIRNSCLPYSNVLVRMTSVARLLVLCPIFLFGSIVILVSVWRCRFSVSNRIIPINLRPHQWSMWTDQLVFYVWAKNLADSFYSVCFLLLFFVHFEFESWVRYLHCFVQLEIECIAHDIFTITVWVMHKVWHCISIFPFDLHELYGFGENMLFSLDSRSHHLTKQIFNPS